MRLVECRGQYSSNERYRVRSGKGEATMGGRASRAVAVDHRYSEAPAQTRRTWMKIAALSFSVESLSSVRAQVSQKTPVTPEEEKAIAVVRDKAKKAGLSGFETRRTGHFVGEGDGAAQ